MSISAWRPQFKIRREFWLQLVVYLVGVHGVFVIAITLLDQFRGHSGMHITGIDIDVPLLIGFGLVYLSSLLRRRKRTAWSVALLAYMFMLGFYARQIELATQHHDWLEVISKLGLPLLNIGLLAAYRRRFTVRSDIRSFGYTLRFIVLTLVLATVYGTSGFLLMDTHDFHHEISTITAVRQTLGQFGLPTATPIEPHSRRAELFEDSITVVGVATLAVTVISLFQPIRAYYGRRHDNAPLAEALLAGTTGNSEDFFKLWPHDKAYYLDPAGQSGVAYQARNGVALAVGDPLGTTKAASAMLPGFEDLCYGNDWMPVFVHTTPGWNRFYERHGYRLQKIGEEAIVSLDHFQAKVRQAKYFRQVTNKFARQDYTSEVLLPPHSEALINRLRAVSDDWLRRPGRAERGFVMGYFSEPYLQQCPVVIARDSAGTIQAFLNQLPPFDPAEANFDMLRHASGALGNSNDFLLLAFIEHLAADPAVKRLNLGLCPLSGLADEPEKSITSRALEFVYSNGDRFYSFSGLRRFKTKYEPDWQPRYVAYKGSPANFVKAMTVLTRAMRVDKKLLGK